MFDFDELDAIDEVLPSEPAPPETPVAKVEPAEEKADAKSEAEQRKEEAEDTATAPGSDDASTDGCNSGKDGSEDKEDEPVEERPASLPEPKFPAQPDAAKSAARDQAGCLCATGFLTFFRRAGNVRS
jgi:outer membrane biosynthesis protein TonB